MEFTALKLLAYFFISAGVHCTNQISWLRCKFNDEEVSFKEVTAAFSGAPQNTWDTKVFPKNALLQFGVRGAVPVNPNNVTFLITPSKLDIRRFLEGVDVDQLTCEVQRYSTEGIHVRWPVKGEHEYNRWFTCRIKDSKGLEMLIFIRQSTNQPPSGQHDYRNWTVIEDNAVLNMSVVMVMRTQTALTAPLRSEQKLHCQYYTDHKAAKVTVEWHKYGCKYESKYKCTDRSKVKCTDECKYVCASKEKTTLFKWNSQSGAPQGSGVTLKGLATGNATYTIPITNISSEGSYMCSVHLYPLSGTLTTSLHIEEPPQVSLNVDTTLSLTVGAEKKVECAAVGYYHVNPTIHWSHQGASDVGPVVQEFPPHDNNNRKCEGTFSAKAYFTIKAKLSDSGRQFTCTVFHPSIKVPIQKSFTLTVEESGQWIFFFSLFLLVGVVFFTWNYLCKVRRKPHLF